MTSVMCTSGKIREFVLFVQASVVVFLSGCGDFTNLSFSYETFVSPSSEGKPQDELLVSLDMFFDQSSQEGFSCESQTITNSLDKNEETENENMIKLKRECGFDNQILLEYYSKAISDVNELTDSKYITIDSYYADLNEDGFIDVLIILDSVLHSGSAGVCFDILVNNGDGTYREEFRTLMRISSYPAPNEPIDEFYLSDKSNNGFFDICIIRDEIVFARLSYINDVYEVVY